MDLNDELLQTLADGLNDIETVRKSQANRYRQLTSTKPDKDGETRGFGLDEQHPAVAALAAQLATLEALEKSMVKEVERQLRAHPLWAWVKEQNGLGAKTVARLLATIRDPYWNDLHDRPRTFGELKAFCGVAGPGYTKRKGQRVNWNPDARMRLWNIVQPIIKNRRSRYRAVYDQGRKQYTDAIHTEPCVRCGPSGKPAPAGSPLSLAHQHARAERLVMQEILRDLYDEARTLHESEAA